MYKFCRTFITGFSLAMCREVEIERQGKRLLVCSISGLPLTIKNHFGRFCEDECDIDAMIHAKVQSEHWMNDMGPIFKRGIENE